jgi:hypothetical protein
VFHPFRWFFVFRDESVLWSFTARASASICPLVPARMCHLSAGGRTGTPAGAGALSQSGRSPTGNSLRGVVRTLPTGGQLPLASKGMSEGRPGQADCGRIQISCVP